MTPRKILITGATGFVGAALVRRMIARGDVLPVAATRASTKVVENSERRHYEAGVRNDWRALFEDIEVVVHLAGDSGAKRPASNTTPTLEEINVRGTLDLAREAANAGVRRFVFVSSVKVNGEKTTADSFFGPQSPAAPEDAYGESKRDAENALRLLAEETGLDVVIVRPPLVYGPGMKGNARNLLRLAETALPLPFANVRNRRSVVYVENLAELLLLCAFHPDAKNRTFFASDPEDPSTGELLGAFRTCLGKDPGLFSVPPNLLELAARAIGKEELGSRVFGSLRVDSEETRRVLGWKSIPLREGIRRTVSSILDETSSQSGQRRMNSSTVRAVDVVLATAGLSALSPLLVMVLVIAFFDTGSPIFVQERVGKGQARFRLVKFRTMSRSTESVATHLVSRSQVTRLGSILRKTKLDELPQLINVISGSMSLVGPRPCLANQSELLAAREALGVFDVRPGITGLAQVKTIDMSTPDLLARTDREMIVNFTITDYFRYIFQTVAGSGAGDRVVR